MAGQFWMGMIHSLQDHIEFRQLIRISKQTVMKKLPFLLLSVCALFSCAQNQEELPIVFPDGDWEEKTPEELGVDSEKLEEALAYLASKSGEDGLEEVFIVRKGYLIRKGDSISKVHNIYSCSKSFTSTVLGLLVDQGTVSEETYAKEIDPNLAEYYPKLQLKHFASMTSGYSAKGDSRWNEPSKDWSWTPFAIDTPLFVPGEEYAYWDEAMMMYGRLLSIKSGKTLKSIFMEGIGNEIGFRDFEWWGDEEYNGLPLNNGCTGVTIDAERLARFGHLYLNKGNWDGKQLLSKEWVNKATQNQVFAKKVADTDRNHLDGRGSYGYNFWINGMTPSGKYFMPDSPKSLYYASGLHNNMCFVIPEWDMVFVRRGEDGNPPEGKHIVYNEFFKRLAVAVDKTL